MKKSTANFIRGIVSKQGIQYKPALLPKDIERGQPGDCFDWCMMQVLNNRDYRYVEGVAQDPTDPSNWVYHAWLTDGVHAFDPTWQAVDNNGIEHAVPTIHVGIEFDIKEVAEFVSVTEYKAVLANKWRAPELFKRMRKGELLA